MIGGDTELGASGWYQERVANIERNSKVVKSQVRMLGKIETKMCQNIRQEKRLKQSNPNIRYKDRAKIS